MLSEICLTEDKMKRFLALILSLLFVLGALLACGKKKSADTDAYKQNGEGENTLDDELTELGESVVYDNKDDEPQPHVPKAESTAGKSGLSVPRGRARATRSSTPLPTIRVMAASVCVG